MLIASPRHTPADLAHWRRLELLDRELARLPRLLALETQALGVLRSFLADGPAYVSVSWGKDSVVLAHLAVRIAREGISAPIVWFPAGRIENPDCPLVRDAFLARFPDAAYHEVPAPLSSDDWNRAEGHDGAQAEFERAARAWGPRYVSGVRAEESSTRGRAVARHGLATRQTARPLGRWLSIDVFAYLARHDLPVHPAYACTFGGALDRGRVRVGTLGGYRGRGRGRLEWEQRYYRDAIALLGE